MRACAQRSRRLLANRVERPSRATSRIADRALSLQQTLGNQAWQRLAAAQLIQPKLHADQANDRHEQDAKRVADRILRTPAAQQVSLHCACGGSCPRCQTPPAVQAKRTGSQSPDALEQEADTVADQVVRQSSHATEIAQISRQTSPRFACPAVRLAAENPQDAPAVVRDVLRSPGTALDAATRRFFEARLGQDFSAVRVHSDAKAAQSACALHALAYTAGRDVVFAAGHYAPATEQGKHLLAHELTHVVQQGAAPTGTIQRAPAPPPAKMPTLTTPQTTTFFADLNAALATVLSVKANLGPADFAFKSGADFAAYIKQTSELSSDYVVAEEQATEVCSTRTPAAVAALCGTDRQCPQDIKRTQSNPKLCRNTQATDEFVSWFIRTRGVTPPGGGPSVVIEENTQNAMLLDIVHEGVHRLRGAIWKQRSRIGSGYTHTRSKPPVRLAHIGQDLDEGSVQIITDLVIGELQKLRGRSWFKGYTSTAYAGAVAKANKMLADHGQDVGFLKRAYTATTSVNEVEDLQLWQ
jgi:hypothetical protein